MTGKCAAVRILALALGLAAAKAGSGADGPSGELEVADGAEWVAFRFDSEIRDGSLPDFSDILPADRPADARHGRLVADRDGHLVGEKSGERVRLVGAT